MRAPRAAKESLRSERRSARHDVAGHRHFGAVRRKKHACANGLEKSEAQFGLPLTRAIERRFRRSSRSPTRRRPLTADPAERERSQATAVDSRGGGSRWSAGRRSAPDAGDPRKETFCGARRARSASGWQRPPAWRGHTLAPPGASFPCLFGLAWLAWRSVA